MKKFTEGMQVRFSMLYGGTVTAKVTKVTDTQITLTESWIAEDTMETVSEDTVYDKQVDENGNEYIITWEYYDHKGTVYGEEDKVVDLREVKDTVKATVAELRAEDPNWSWKADVLKNEIRVWWGYLQYCDNEDSHFTIRMGTTEEGNLDNDFITARDEHNHYVAGALIGSECYCDGDLAKCVARLLRALASRTHRYY